MNTLMIIVPCYNEEEVLQYTIPALTEVLDRMISKSKISNKSGILLVNDGSKDSTWEIIKKAHYENNHILGLNLSSNVGHQNALMAGYEKAYQMCDACISIDADLQDDINAIEEMADKFISGCDIVYGVRSDRKTDSFFKRFTAQLFYKIMQALGVNIVYNHADFRLLSSKAVLNMLQYDERNLFLRGIISRLGQKTDVVYYSRKERTHGESKYPLKKMISFAWDGITSFSVKPVSAILLIGVFLTVFSFAALIGVLVQYIIHDAFSVLGFLIAVIGLLSGVQLVSIGVVGEYVGKAYIESKRRPRYHVEEFINYD